MRATTGVIANPTARSSIATSATLASQLRRSARRSAPGCGGAKTAGRMRETGVIAAEIACVVSEAVGHPLTCIVGGAGRDVGDSEAFPRRCSSPTER